MSDLKKGDRVTVDIPPRRSYNGVIVGEGRIGEWWLVLKDGRKHAQGISKSFCQPEPAHRDTDVSGAVKT